MKQEHQRAWRAWTIISLGVFGRKSEKEIEKENKEPLLVRKKCEGELGKKWEGDLGEKCEGELGTTLILRRIRDHLLWVNETPVAPLQCFSAPQQEAPFWEENTNHHQQH